MQNIGIYFFIQFILEMKLIHNIVGKLIVIGDSTVGKTAIVQTYLSSGLKYPNKYNMTVDVEVTAKGIHIPESDDPLKLLFFDTTGLDLYYGCLTSYWENPNMLLIVYDVTSQTSFTNLMQWIELSKTVKWGNSSSEPAACAIFANKTDLTGRRIVNREKGEEMAEKYRMQYFEGSAKTNETLNELFQWFALRWHEHYTKILKK